MKVLNRAFSLKEKILLIALAFILVGLIYYYFVDQQVRTSIYTANAEADSLQVELTAAEKRLSELTSMQDELDSVKDKDSSMPSYNGIKGEMTLLNDIMEETEDYSIAFSNVTRDGDQIRRDFSVQFTAETYKKAVKILQQISDSKYRCELDAVSCSSNNTEKNTDGYYVNGKYIVTNDYSGADREYNNISYGAVTVSFTATFYETMVGGKEDSGLPEETAVDESLLEDEEELSY